ncbi:Protein Daple [Labeo rohita]|uniref:Protein Daple n=1 Tax=Labeo rohita TaxID=84645 RepID=A0ABQ8L5Z2_LABRO|nr:Protein Daple [Labeo rohita]
MWSGRHLSWHINCLEMLAVFRALKYFLPDLRDSHVLVRTDSTAVVYYINHQGGLRSRPLYKPCVVPGQTPLSASSSHSWASECGSRCPVEAGAKARGMDASPRGGEADLESLWSGSSGSLRHEGEHAMFPLVLSSSSSSPGAGCYGTEVAPVRLSPDRSAPGSSGESTPGRGQPTTSSPVLAGPSMVLGPGISPRWLSMGDSRQEGSPLTGGGHHPSPPSLPGVVEAVGVAPEGAQLIASGLSTKVVETILQSRAPSMRKLYALKWKLFTSWCGERQQDPGNCPVGTVLEFLQARFSTGFS